MSYDPLRASSARADAMVHAQASEEALLDRYIEKPSPVRDWLEARARQAPWWTLSFLLHVVVLIMLSNWRLPAPLIEIDLTPIGPPGGYKIYDPPEREQPREYPKPDLERPMPKDYAIGPDAFLEEGTPKRGSGTEAAPGTPGGETASIPLVLPPSPLAPGEPVGPLEAVKPSVPGPPPILGVTFPSSPISPGTPNPLGRRPSALGTPGKDGHGTPGGPDVGPPHSPQVTPLMAALIWLERAQEPDGSWDAKKWDGASSYRVGVTGLALLAYEGAGCTARSGQFHSVVAKALDWLRKNQRENGSFPFETFYEQGIATMAACEGFGMNEEERWRQMAQRAVNYIVAVQPEHGGFRYAGPVERAQGDLSVTGWQIMALKSAKMVGLNVPATAFERSNEFLKNTWRDYGASSYLVGDAGAGSLSMASVGLLCRVFLSKEGEYAAQVDQAARYLYDRETDPLKISAGGRTKELVNDLYYTYYSSLAMFQLQGEYWNAWKRMYMDPLMDAQVKTRLDASGRFVYGSFEPSKHKWGDRGGRVYTTAMAALCFEAPFRFIALYRSR